jgi:hypothetical protein
VIFERCHQCSERSRVFQLECAPEAGCSTVTISCVAPAVEHERNATIGDQGGAGSIRAELYVKGLSITASAGDERQLAIITSLSRWRSGSPRMAQVGHDKLREII